jgi:hypothetical protein
MGLLHLLRRLSQRLAKPAPPADAALTPQERARIKAAAQNAMSRGFSRRTRKMGP